MNEDDDSEEYKKYLKHLKEYINKPYPINNEAIRSFEITVERGQEPRVFINGSELNDTKEKYDFIKKIKEGQHFKFDVKYPPKDFIDKIKNIAESMNAKVESITPLTHINEFTSIPIPKVPDTRTTERIYSPFKGDELLKQGQWMIDPILPDNNVLWMADKTKLQELYRGDIKTGIYKPKKRTYHKRIPKLHKIQIYLKVPKGSPMRSYTDEIFSGEDILSVPNSERNRRIGKVKKKHKHNKTK